MRKLVVLSLFALLAGCGPAPHPVPDQKADDGGILEKPRLGAGTTTWVAISADPDWEKIERQAQSICTGLTQCGVMGWTDKNQIPSVMPMLDREVAAMSFSYSLNRTTGYEAFLRDCTRWPHDDASRCLAKPEPEA